MFPISSTLNTSATGNHIPPSSFVDSSELLFFTSKDEPGLRENVKVLEKPIFFFFFLFSFFSSLCGGGRLGGGEAGSSSGLVTKISGFGEGGGNCYEICVSVVDS
tara:strand:- start:11 stop:325 length:315 start_codon:yes stop_codon:yes gene_type:complete